MTDAETALESMSLKYLERQRGHRAAMERQMEILIEAYKGQSHMINLLAAQVAELKVGLDGAREAFRKIKE